MEDVSTPDLRTQLVLLGNECLLTRCKMAFFSSRQTPPVAQAAIRKWITSLSPHRDCIMIGCLSTIERRTIKYLLDQHIPTIIVLAEALPPEIEHVCYMIPEVSLAEAMGQGRLLLLSTNSNPEECCVTTENAKTRNLWMMNFAPAIIVGYATRYGQLYEQLKGRRSITVLCPPIN